MKINTITLPFLSSTLASPSPNFGTLDFRLSSATFFSSFDSTGFFFSTSFFATFGLAGPVPSSFAYSKTCRIKSHPILNRFKKAQLKIFENRHTRSTNIILPSNSVLCKFCILTVASSVDSIVT